MLLHHTLPPIIVVAEPLHKAWTHRIVFGLRPAHFMLAWCQVQGGRQAVGGQGDQHASLEEAPVTYIYNSHENPWTVLDTQHLYKRTAHLDTEEAREQ